MDQAILIRRAAQYFSNKVAVVYGERLWTFEEVNSRANRLANGLLRLGVQKGDRVATLRTNRPEHVEMFFALLKIGAVSVTINPRLTPAEMAWQINNAGASVLIFTEEFANVVSSIAGELPTLRHCIATPPAPSMAMDYEELLAESSDGEPDIELRGEDLADIGYTSGTTGRPRGVMRDRAGWLAVDRNILLDIVPDLEHGDVFLGAQPLYHGVGRFVLPCWIRGATHVIIPKFDPETVLDAVARHGVTIIKTIPTVLVRLLEHADIRRRELRTVRTIVYGAAPMPVDRLRKALEIFGPVFVQLYGQAEAPMCITRLSKADHALAMTSGATRLLSSAGRPFTLCEVRVVDEAGREVPTGEPGEVIVRGDHVMRGYWNAEQGLTEETLRDGWVFTRDIGYFDEHGYLYLVDRKSEMIISGGLNVYPNEVEQVLYEHPAILEAAVIGSPDPVWGELVKACVVPRPGFTLDAQDVINHCSQRLAAYKRPRVVEFFDALPKTAAGKISRSALRAAELKRTGEDREA